MTSKLDGFEQALVQPKIVLPVSKASRNAALEHYSRLLDLTRQECDGRSVMSKEDVASFAGWANARNHHTGSKDPSWISPRGVYTAL